ncbi:2266_t:CDS:2, partial [Dentiscutata heterogama]
MGKPIIEIWPEFPELVKIFDSPIYKLDGTVWGIMGISTEVTQKVLNDRRLKILGNLSLQTA